MSTDRTRYSPGGKRNESGSRFSDGRGDRGRQKRGGVKGHGKRGSKKRFRPGSALVDVDALERGPKARHQALSILTEADETGTFADQLLDERITSGSVTAEDKFLVQEIVFGAIRHRSTLDQILDNYLQFSMKRQHIAVRWTLRLATYQLVYLSRVPFHAAIHGAVEALKAVNGIETRDAGFANAVLRRIQADIGEKTEEDPGDVNSRLIVPARHGWCTFNRPVLPPSNQNRSVFLALKFSHPKWLISRWISRFGEGEAIQLCGANNRVPLVTAILTDAMPSGEEVIASLEAEGVQVEQGVLPEALRLRRTGDIRQLKAFQKAWIRIQDETAHVIGRALEPAPGSRVLDLCAAPGSKASQILERIGPDGHVVACDSDPQKLDRLRQSLERFGSNFTIHQVSEQPEELDIDELFPYVLVDVPCSNTGVLARRPEVRWRVHGEALPRLAALQTRLLDAALRRLAPGGRLVYSTCSIEPEENGQVVAAIRRRYTALDEEGSRLFLPHRDGADGGYYSILVAPTENWPPTE